MGKIRTTKLIIMNEDLKNNKLFQKEEINNFVAFSSILKRIHNRLISQGYVIKDGQIIKAEGDKVSS